MYSTMRSFCCTLFLLFFPCVGSHIGPEPTTDRFVVCMNGVDERTIPGHTAAVQTDLPFSGLTKFGSAFLEKFQVAQVCPVYHRNTTGIPPPIQTDIPFSGLTNFGSAFLERFQVAQICLWRTHGVTLVSGDP